MVIRQKRESQNGCFKKIKHVKSSKKRTFLTPWYPLLPTVSEAIKMKENIWVKLGNIFLGAFLYRGVCVMTMSTLCKKMSFNKTWGCYIGRRLSRELSENFCINLRQNTRPWDTKSLRRTYHILIISRFTVGLVLAQFGSLRVL